MIKTGRLDPRTMQHIHKTPDTQLSQVHGMPKIVPPNSGSRLSKTIVSLLREVRSKPSTYSISVHDLALWFSNQGDAEMLDPARFEKVKKLQMLLLNRANGFKIGEDYSVESDAAGTAEIYVYKNAVEKLCTLVNRH